MAHDIDLTQIRASGFVQDVQYFEQVGSTNDVALAEAQRAEVKLPLLVLAEQQTAGRGRGQNRWWSSAGALTFSLVLDASQQQFPTERCSLVSLTCGVAVCRALEKFLPQEQLGLKWPNDVYLRGRKLCGILVEMPAVRPRRVIIGIGINVLNSFQEAPTDVQQRAISLVDAGIAAVTRTDVLSSVLEQLELSMNLLQRDPEALVAAWDSLCILRGKLVHVAQGSQRIIGICEGIDPDGALVLRTETTRQRCLAGVVEQIEW